MKAEIQPIVFAAGPGSRMNILTGHKTKSLLPIGNYPLVYYPLKLLEDSGFEEATVIINSKDERDFKKLNEVYGLKIRLELVVVDTINDPGTADSLRLIENKIKKNAEEILLMTSDLLTDVSLKEMLSFHTSRGAGLTMLTTKLINEKILAPGPKNKSHITSDILCYEENTPRLVYAIAGGDYDEKVSIPSKVANSIDFGIEMNTSLTDAHVYIMKRWMVDYILEKDSFGSIKAEIIPNLISLQFNHNVHKETDLFEDLIMKYNTSVVESRFKHNSKLNKNVCYAFQHSGKCLRVNTMDAFWAANAKIHEWFPSLLPKNVSAQSTTEISEKSHIDESSLIGRGAKISDKTTIISSIIGDHAKVSSKVRISKSLIFDHVLVEEGCVIENSLICANIDKKCTIKNCIVTDSSKIIANKTYVNEALESFSEDYSY